MVAGPILIDQKVAKVGKITNISLFSLSHWLTTLLSVVNGSLILVLIGLMVGPCILIKTG